MSVQHMKFSELTIYNLPSVHRVGFHDLTHSGQSVRLSFDCLAAAAWRFNVPFESWVP